jgi:hypothetical protein
MDRVVHSGAAASVTFRGGFMNYLADLVGTMRRSLLLSVRRLLNTNKVLLSVSVVATVVLAVPVLAPLEATYTTSQITHFPKQHVAKIITDSRSITVSGQVLSKSTDYYNRPILQLGSTTSNNVVVDCVLDEESASITDDVANTEQTVEGLPVQSNVQNDTSTSVTPLTLSSCNVTKLMAQHHIWDFVLSIVAGFGAALVAVLGFTTGKSYRFDPDASSTTRLTDNLADACQDMRNVMQITIVSCVVLLVSWFYALHEISAYMFGMTWLFPYYVFVMLIAISWRAYIQRYELEALYHYDREKLRCTPDIRIDIVFESRHKQLVDFLESAKAIRSKQQHARKQHFNFISSPMPDRPDLVKLVSQDVLTVAFYPETRFQRWAIISSTNRTTLAHCKRCACE